MRERILILDDDMDVLFILREVLVYEGFDPTVVDSTDDLFKLVRDHQPALILLDFALQGTNGGDLCNQLKNNPEFAAIPVIMFSAYSTKGFAKGSFGCDDFIAKPFDLEDLTTRIKSLTSRGIWNAKPEISNVLKKQEHIAGK